MLEKLGKFKLLVVGALVSFLFIAITIGQLQKRQETRSRAAGQAVSVILDPLTKNVNVGDEFDVKVNINGGQNDISAVDISITYDKNLFDVPFVCPAGGGSCFDSSPFVPSSVFSTIQNEADFGGSVNFVGVNPTSNAITGSSINIGLLHFKAKAAGTANVGFSNIHINASGVSGALPVDTENTKSGTYSIGETIGASPSPTPTGSISCESDSDCPLGQNCVGEPVSPGSDALIRVCRSTGTPTLTQTPTSTPTSTPNPQETRILLSLALTGIGNATESARGLNNNPRRATRAVEIKILNAQNQEIISSRGSATYNSATGQYKGSVSLGNNFQSGPYAIKVRMDNTLRKSIPGIQNIIQGTSYAAPKTELVSGNFNQDNEINLLDYNLMISCLADTQCRNNPQAE